MIDFKFPDLDTVIKVRDMVRKVSDINASTDTSDIFELNNELNDIAIKQDLMLHLSEPQAHALDLILDLFKDVDADECNVAWDISKVFKIIIAPSDVRRFIAMLKDFCLAEYLPNDTVRELFKDWTMQEGLNQIARDCMDLIVATGNSDWWHVYVWLSDNDASRYTDVEKELDKFKEAIWQRAQDS